MKDIDKINWLVDYYTGHSYIKDEINLFGIRNSIDIEKDAINDYLGFWTKDNLFICKGTTEPGVYWTKDKAERNKNGTFHLKEMFHEKIWCFGIHKGYEALVNNYKYCKPTKGWRDTDYNFIQDSKDIEVCDYFGINFHRMHPIQIVDKIGKYSAGCQVVQNAKEFMNILEVLKSTEMYKNNKNCTFNYMLFDIKEIPKEFLIL